MSNFPFEYPSNAINVTSDSILLPFRTYAFEILKFIKSFMFLDRLQKLNWNTMTTEQKKLYAPVIIFATPQRAYSDIVTPLLNGQLASFGISIKYNNIKNVEEMNATPYLLEYAYYEKDNIKKRFFFKRPMCFEIEFGIDLVAISSRDAEELIFRWEYQFPFETSLIYPYDIETLVFWQNGSWINNTNLEPALEAKNWYRYSTSLYIHRAYYPTELFGSPEINKKINKIFVNINLEEINKTVEIII